MINHSHLPAGFGNDFRRPKKNARINRAFSQKINFNYSTKDSFNLLATETKNPRTIIKIPVHTRLTNGFTEAATVKTSPDFCPAVFSALILETINSAFSDAGSIFFN